MANPIVDCIIDNLYNWITNYRGREVIKDTTRINCKYDAFIDSNPTNPLSFTVFEMTNKGELIIDDPGRLVDSQAAFFLFVNVDTRWVVAVKNTTKNQSKLVRKEPIENFRVKIIQ
ncbi:MAG: hypothetical protein AB1782_02235 [Cyanobacteriota bacterium]